MRRTSFGLAVVLAGCGPAPRASGPIAPPTAPAAAPEVVSNVTIDERGEGPARILDGESRWSATVPAGWRASARFRADASGPPAAGALRARIEEPVAGCVVHLAVEAALDARDPAPTLSRGRELFFLAETEEPRPGESFAISRVIAGTFIPHDPTRVDVGYWLELGDGRWLRAEGRFPVSAVVPCKAKLDEIVRSLARIGPALESGPAAKIRRPDDGG